MKIQQLDLTVRDLVAGYQNDGGGSVVGNDGAPQPKSPFVKASAFV